VAVLFHATALAGRLGGTSDRKLNLSLEPGQMLLHYRLVEKIGEGGMGVVWQATDTTLGREVAVKLLPDLFSEDPERLGRFEREAKVLASLNHPGIASIYGFQAAEGHRFLSMELVPGEDLSERMGRGALPVDEVIQRGHSVGSAAEVVPGKRR
jgi:eukaryotic-like serine/threonine-protein kinase